MNIEIVYYTDGTGYYNHNGVSYDFTELNELKTELKEKFNFDYIKSAHSITDTSTLGKKHYNIEIK